METGTASAAEQISEPEQAWHRCRACEAPIARLFADLGSSPLANAYLTEAEIERPEPFFPLRVHVCEQCFLVQLATAVDPRVLFDDYAYFSSYSESWLHHAREYVDQVTERFALGATSSVVEVASNDGYLLQYFQERGVPVLGIEPARNVAAAAQAAGIPTQVEFFGRETGERIGASDRAADLLVANNVLAHVPDLNGFVAGVRAALKPRGVATMEFPHLLRLMEHTEFDTIYHEHVSYFSLLAVERVLMRAGLALFDVEQLPTHGGSLRIYARRKEVDEPTHERLEQLRELEASAGLDRIETYTAFDERVRQVKRDLLSFLIEAKDAGRSIVGYGAPAKATTLLNYCGVRRDFIDYVVDRSPHKQGRFLPGTHIPIRDPDEVARTKPDYLLILPWNLRDEIMEQMDHVRTFGCRFVVPIPEPTVLD
jgi:SAM-dependent methyltransferase